MDLELIPRILLSAHVYRFVCCIWTVWYQCFLLYPPCCLSDEKTASGTKTKIQKQVPSSRTNGWGMIQIQINRVRGYHSGKERVVKCIAAMFLASLGPSSVGCFEFKSRGGISGEIGYFNV